MRKTILLLFLSLFSFGPLIARADEGMWLLMFLDKQTYKDMKAKGLKLSPKQIYDINKASLKDAVVQFGRGCTGEIISNEGLLLTNHHCGYGEIQSHSSVEHDYLLNGFWAYSKAEELPCPGLTAKFLIRMEDVSSSVLKGVDKTTSEKDREGIVAKNIKDLQEKIVENEKQKGNNYVAQIMPMFDGNQYILFVYEIFNDVRMVGAPPSSIGKFGSDTDNWMWPRHTCDFSMFRVYSDKNGKPASYSPNNVPLKPKHFLPVSLKGVQPNDFTMIMGFPGTTERFMTSQGVKNAIDVYNPSVVTARTALRNVMEAQMNKEDHIRIQYASKFAQLSNYWKFYIGQTKCLNNLNVIQTKKDLEARLDKWIKVDNARQQEYGNVLSDIEKYSASTFKYDYLSVYFNEALYRGSSCPKIAMSFFSLQKELAQNGNSDKAKQMTQALKENLKDIFKDCDQETEQKLFATGLDVFFKNVPISQQSPEFLDLAFKNSYNFDKISKDLFAKSNMVSEQKAMALLDDPTAEKITKDPMYALVMQMLGSYRQQMANIEEDQEALTQAHRLYEKAIMEMDKNKNFAPDANLTIRYTYGQVKNYKPMDGVTYNYYTTLDGVMAKEDSSSWEFAVPAKLKQLWKAKDYGQYAVGGTVPVAFISNNDITGGNSGSPVINGKGELVGIAFDGNWEAMSGNIAFNPELQRCINVDIRYVMFIIDKFAGAKNLINEIKFVK